MVTKCFNCGADGVDMYGYTICENCKSDLGLFSDETISRQRDEFATKSTQKYAETYEEDIDYRLDFVEKDMIKKKLKLLHIKDRLEQM